MSFNNALPYWVFELAYEHDLALMSCAFDAEWFAGTHKVMPEHLINISKATFATWKFGGWNYRYSKEEIEEMKREAKEYFAKKEQEA